jgi:2,3-bisphosphoglycerate-independent phosphoglycerate mutase
MNTDLKKSALIIIDGLGLADDEQGNAASRRTMPYLHSLMDEYGFARLEASGPAIGLDEGQAGNSEVGHLTIGAGRVLPTMLNRIRTDFDNGEWADSPVWKSIQCRKKLHVVGMVSGAGVHAHWATIAQAAKLASDQGFEKIYLHLFLDGVDSPARSAPNLLSDLIAACSTLEKVHIATISGRKWAADRSGDLSISEYCANGLFGRHRHSRFSDDALRIHLDSGQSEASFPFHYADLEGVMLTDDAVLFTQHRIDRVRQLASALVRRTRLYSLAQIDGVVGANQVFFPTRKLTHGLVHTLAESGIHASRIAETCKFPHVTYFMNGMRDDLHKAAFEIPSIPEERIATQPKMCLDDLQARVEAQLAESADCALIINIPNLDQVGHTGDLALAQQAAQYVDQALCALVSLARKHRWSLVITADHGNADRMLDDQGKPLGSHSSNPVPLLVIDATGKKPEFKRTTGTLANVAATYLATLGMAAPSFMDESLVEI